MLPLPIEFDYWRLRQFADYFAALPPDQRDAEFKYCADFLRVAKKKHKWLVYAGVFDENDET